MQVDIWHNLLWSRYKGGVFSALYRGAAAAGVDTHFFQIAETANNRQNLGPVDRSYHQYPFELLFAGAYEAVRIDKIIFELLRRTWSSSADLVVLAGYDRPEYWCQLLALMIRRTPRGVFCDSTAYDNPPSRLKHGLKSFFFRNCQVIFCYGERSRQYILSHGVADRNIRFRCQAAALPHDYDVGRAVEQRVSCASAAPRFLYVGRMSPEKNLDRLIEAFAAVRTNAPNAILRLVGDGPERTALESRAREQGVADAVVFVGSRGNEELAAEYLSATCLILPSLSEPWGLVVNEALAYGCPVIVSDRCGCVPELAGDGRCGMVFDAERTDQLAERMQRAGAQWSDARATALACTQVIGRFTPEAAAAQILDGCLAVIDPARVHAPA